MTTRNGPEADDLVDDDPTYEKPKRRKSRGGDQAKTQPTSFWLDDETKNNLARLGEELGLNRSAVVREAIRRMSSEDPSTEVRRLVAELGRVVAGGGDVATQDTT